MRVMQDVYTVAAIVDGDIDKLENFLAYEEARAYRDDLASHHDRTILTNRRLHAAGSSVRYGEERPAPDFGGSPPDGPQQDGKALACGREVRKTFGVYLFEGGKMYSGGVTILGPVIVSGIGEVERDFDGPVDEEIAEIEMNTGQGLQYVRFSRGQLLNAIS